MSPFLLIASTDDPATIIPVLIVAAAIAANIYRAYREFKKKRPTYREFHIPETDDDAATPRTQPAPAPNSGGARDLWEFLDELRNQHTPTAVPADTPSTTALDKKILKAKLRKREKTAAATETPARTQTVSPLSESVATPASQPQHLVIDEAPHGIDHPAFADNTRDALKRAVVLKEVLDRPLGLR